MWGGCLSVGFCTSSGLGYGIYGLGPCGRSFRSSGLGIWDLGFRVRDLWLKLSIFGPRDVLGLPKSPGSHTLMNTILQD